MPSPMDADDTERSRVELVAQLILLGEIDSTQTAHFHQTASARTGIGVTDTKALSILLRDGPQTAGALMTALNLTSGAVTGVIDRLRARGLVHRDVDPADKRRAIIRVDPDGLARQDDVYSAIGAAFERLYAGYTDEELRFLARHLRASIEITRAETAALTGGISPRGRGGRAR